ncbi:DEAD protein [Rhizoctonia solani]|uniref:DEAD protein n=1 Tax=Rhizoctonia solani TaxID=456999 RepID=A0A8H7M8W2_9AGAM|nr:DEAD protein [Rhizoctonia solani]
MTSVESDIIVASHSKKSKKSKSKTEDATTNAEDTVMTNEDTQELSKKDKKKRKKSSDTSPEEDTNIDKAERKRRKREAGADPVPAAEENTIVEPAKESKEERKKRKAEKRAQREALAQSSSQNPTPVVDAPLPTPPPTASSPSGEVVPILKFSQLASFGVDDRLIKATDKFKEPSFIQACSWPASLRGNDVVGIAETGSGKTLAFGLPALQHILSSSAAPAEQGSKKSKKSKKQSGTTEVTRKALLSQNGDGRTTRIVVGTPGRLKDFVEEGVCDLSRVTYLVLDEADRMLDKGFENDIRSIIEKTAPMEKRQTLMFSATWPESVRRLASTFQRDPVRVTVGKMSSRPTVVSNKVFDDVREKDRRLIQRLKELGHNQTPPALTEWRGGKSGKSVTFFTGADHERALAGEFARVLKDNGFDANPLKKKTHGAYGAFFRDDIPADAAPKKIKF